MPENDPDKIDLNLDEETVGGSPEDAARAAEEAIRKAAESVSKEKPSAALPAALAQQLVKLQAEKDELLKTMVRRQADFENYKKRIERERTEDRNRATSAVIESILPVLDGFERALAAHDDPAYEEYRKGLEIIYRQLLDVLLRCGLETIEAEGQPFDPNFHHAVERVVSTEHEDGTVIEVHERGYKFRDRVLRPAMVRVSYRPEHTPPTEPEGPPV